MFKCLNVIPSTNSKVYDIITNDLYIIFFLFFLSFLIRIINLYLTPVINNDGVLYIYQAQKVFSGAWRQAINWGYNFIPFSTFVIVLFFKIFHNWIIAARLCSIVFASLAVIPFYLVFRFFFSKRIVFLLSCSFILSPFFIDRSVDIIKGPIYWFLSLWGFYFFVLASKKNRFYIYTFSSLCFILAIWCRFEAVVFFIASLISILFVNSFSSFKVRIKSLIYFLMPLLFIGIISWILFLTDIFNHRIIIYNLYLKHRLSLVSDRFGYLNHYRSQLTKLWHLTHGYFWLYIRHILYILPLLFVISRIFSLLGILSIFFLLGLRKVTAFINKNKCSKYLAIATIGAFLLLVLWSYKGCVLSERYMVVFILPSFLVIGVGIEELFFILKRVDKLKLMISLLVIFFSVAICNLHFKRENKVAFKEAGLLINRLEKSRAPVKIATSESLIVFYANVNRIPTVPYNSLKNYKELVNSPDKLSNFLLTRGYKYFIWEGKLIRKDRKIVLGIIEPLFKKVGEFENSKLGELIVFRRKYSN